MRNIAYEAVHDGHGQRAVRAGDSIPVPTWTLTQGGRVHDAVLLRGHQLTKGGFQLYSLLIYNII